MATQVAAMAGTPPLRAWLDTELGGHAQNFSVLPVDGRVYVGNGHGVRHYDGTRWTLIATEQETRVRDVALTRDGRVLYVTADDAGELVRDATGQHRFDSWRSRIALPPGALGDPFDISETPFGIVVQSPRWIAVFAPDGSVHTVAAPREFHIGRWCGGRYVVPERTLGLAQLTSDGKNLVAVPGGERFAGQMLLGCADVDGGALFAFARAGLQRFDGSAWTAVPSDADAWLATHFGLSFARLADGSFVLGSLDGGLLALDASGAKLFHMQRAHGLPSNAVAALAADARGQLWAGIEGGMVALAWPGPVTQIARDLELGNVDAVAEHAGRLFVGTQRGLWVLDGTAPSELRALPDWSRQTFGVTSYAGSLWLATIGGVYRAQVDDAGAWVGSPTRVLDTRFAYTMLPGPDGALYVGADRGIARIDVAGTTPPQWIDSDRGEVRVLAVHDDALWAGANQGVWRIAPRDDDSLDVTVFGAGHGLPRGFTGPLVIDGTLAIGTLQGLFDHLPQRTPPFACATGFAARFCSTEVYRSIAARDGGAWMRLGAHTGRVLRSRTQYTFDAAPLGAAALPAAHSLLEDSAGVLWLATRAGLFRYDPRRAAQRTPAPLSGVDVTGWRTDAGDLPLRDAAPLPPNPARLRVDFAWRHDATSSATQFRTQLVGLESDWSTWRDEAFRELATLPGGEYRLRMQARDALGVQSAPSEFAFSVMTPWYLRPWAWIGWSALLLTAIVLLARGYARYRSMRLEARNQALQAQVATRTAELARSNEDLAARHREIALQHERLERLDQAKNQFFAGVSHELRTPLTLILNLLRGMRGGRAGPLSRAADDDIALAERSARELTGLVDQILQVNRAAARGVALVRRDVDMAQLVRQAASLFESLAEREGRVLTVAGADAPLAAEVDPDQVLRAVVNLLANAFKYSPRQSPVAILLQQHAGDIAITVRDQGRGIAAADLPHIFDLYYRGTEAAAERTVGSGIGLSLVQGIAQAHGGSVEVMSAAGEGSTFTLQLPRGAATRAENAMLDTDELANLAAAAAAPLATLPSLADDADVPLVLVADDNPELCELIARRLAARYRVETCADGVAALAAARRLLPDAVMTDWQMPHGDGLTLCRALRADPTLAGIAILMVAGRDAQADRTDALAAGADDFVAKPFDVDELEARVAGLLRARRILREWHPPAPIPAAAEDPFVARARAAVLARLDDSSFGVVELAQTLHMDRTGLFRRLKSALGMAPVEYMRRVRLDCARERLAGGEGTVSEIAYACGFESLSYFSRMFRETFGELPSALLAGRGTR